MFDEKVLIPISRRRPRGIGVLTSPVPRKNILFMTLDDLV